MGYSTDHTSDCYHFWNPVKNGVIETCDAIFLYQMYFSRNDHTPMLQVEPEDEIVDAWDLLAKDEGSDSVDEWEPPMTKSVTFADAVDTTVKSASADKAPFSWPSTGAQSASLSASQPQTILKSGRLSTPLYYFKPETNLAQRIMSQTETSVAEANYLAHMLELDNIELSANQIALDDTLSPEHLLALYQEMVANSGDPPELMGVGAGADGGFGHTNELWTSNYCEAMASPDHHLWEEAIRQK
jgi:hypothetical protein